MFLEKKEEKVDDGRGGHRWVTKETMVFPRYQQLDAVRRLVASARNDGTGRNYLIQHSAGSGKTNSISWLSHRLASLHDARDAKVFNCVIVITDRQVLDRQLQDAIYQIEHAQGVFGKDQKGFLSRIGSRAESEEHNLDPNEQQFSPAATWVGCYQSRRDLAIVHNPHRTNARVTSVRGLHSALKDVFYAML